MTLPKPNLDDKAFDQLLEEARTLIPRYAPEWTDHNLSDPGITFIDLFAWLTEATLYRINLITDRHRLKYLKLLGVRPEPAHASKVDITLVSSKKELLEEGTIVVTEQSGKSVYFELDEEITAVPVNLKKVIVDEITGVFDRTDANEKDDLFYTPFGLNVRKNSAFYIGFDNSSDTVSFVCYLYENDLIEPGKHGNESEYAFKNAELSWQYSGLSEDGTKMEWKSISPKFDGTEGFKKSGRLLFEEIKGWKSTTIPISKDNDNTPYYWLRCIVEESGFEYPPRINTVKLNTISATHGLTTKDEREWTSIGLPHQVFKLSKKPVLNKSIFLEIDGTQWEEVDDLDGSGPGDNHFILDRKNGEIEFGDGLFGRVPPVGSTINVKKYRIGGGEEGNVLEELEWTIGEVNDMNITNHHPASGGAEAETIDDAVARFQKDLRIPYTTVTSEDFEYIAKNTPSLRVAKAKAIPNHHPEKGDIKGSVTIAVIPFSPLESFEIPPLPSEGFKDAICRHIDKHRLLGTAINIVSPLYVKVTANVKIVPLKGFVDESIRQLVINRIDGFIHPIKGWTEGTGWPIGRIVSRSEIYEVIEAIDGVDCVIGVSLSGDKGAAIDVDGNLVLPSKTATVYSGTHTVTIIKEAEVCKTRKK